MPATAQHRGTGGGGGDSVHQDAQRRQRNGQSGNSAGAHGGRAAGSAAGSREAGSSPNSPRSRASLDEQVAAARRRGKQDKDACKLHLVLTYVQVCGLRHLAAHGVPTLHKQACSTGPSGTQETCSPTGCKELHPVAHETLTSMDASLVARWFTVYRAGQGCWWLH